MRGKFILTKKRSNFGRKKITCDKNITLYEENVSFVREKFLLVSKRSPLFCGVKCLCDGKAFVSKKLLFGGEKLLLGERSQFWGKKSHF